MGSASGFSIRDPDRGEEEEEEEEERRGGGEEGGKVVVVVGKMFASVGPRGGPRPPVAPAIPEPDLSHLTEDERKIIMAVLARQREEEAKEEAMLK